MSEAHPALTRSSFDPFQGKLIGADDPLAKAALDVGRRYPGRSATRVHGKAFDGLPVEEVALHPSLLPVLAA